MKDRLAKFLKNEGLSPSRFAEIMGIPPSNVSHLLAGRNKPGFEFISKMILRFPKMSPDWLLTGNGPLYRLDSDQAMTLKPAVNNHPQADERNVQELFPSNPAIQDKFENDPAKNEVPATKPMHESVETHLSITSLNGNIPAPAKKIERIIIFFDDHTFTNFTPSFED